jgi:Ser/Thr protein kinase RdoA (MazF antagonist)
MSLTGPDQLAGVDTPRQLPSGALSRVWLVPGPAGPVVVKLAEAAAVAREAAALAALADDPVVPRLLAAGDGVLVTSLVVGDSRPVAGWSPGAGRLLGVALRRVHESAATASGQWPDWATPAWTLPAHYQRVAETTRGSTVDADRSVVDEVLGRLPGVPDAAAPAFRRLHGDLWSANVLWDADAPSLVDWEYSRQGDPAEDLAYLFVMDAAPDAVMHAVVRGYDDPLVAARIDAWLPLVALVAAVWYRTVGDDERAGSLLRQALRLVSSAG